MREEAGREIVKAGKSGSGDTETAADGEIVADGAPTESLLDDFPIIPRSVPNRPVQRIEEG